MLTLLVALWNAELKRMLRLYFGSKRAGWAQGVEEGVTVVMFVVLACMTSVVLPSFHTPCPGTLP